MNDRILSYLGLARRANRVSLGHDASLTSVLKQKAKLILLTEDASDRLKREFERAASGQSIKIFYLPFTMADIWKAVGVKAGVLTINDTGFANKMISICDIDDKEEWRI